MRLIHLVWSGLVGAVGASAVATEAAPGLVGRDFLDGIRRIIGIDISPEEVRAKPLSGSFSTIHNEADPLLAEVQYCLTDKACGHEEAYGTVGVPLEDLSCNQFCYIDAVTRVFVPSTIYSPDHPPPQYLNCGWETCG